MTLLDICHEIAGKIEGLLYGTIEFKYDNMMSAMKPGHPGEILDDILSIIGWDVFGGKVPTNEKVQETIAGLEEFQSAFGVDLQKQINDLKNYIA